MRIKLENTCEEYYLKLPSWSYCTARVRGSLASDCDLQESGDGTSLCVLRGLDARVAQCLAQMGILEIDLDFE